jgi:hypothetical protein
MLPNGDTGVYHKSYVDDSVNEQHSVVWQTSWRNTYNEENSLTMPQRMECSVKLLYSSETRYSMKIRLEPLVLRQTVTWLINSCHSCLKRPLPYYARRGYLVR